MTGYRIFNAIYDYKTLYYILYILRRQKGSRFYKHESQIFWAIEWKHIENTNMPLNTAEVTEEPKKLLVSGTFAGNFKMATDDCELFWQFVSNPWVSYSAETLVVIMDSDGIRRPPKPASQLSTALFLSPQLDLTPEKKTNKPKQNFQKNVSEAPTENTKESKEIYAWYVYCNGMLFLQS